MAIKINETILRNINFNNKTVNKCYFNGNLVFSKGVYIAIGDTVGYRSSDGELL